MCRSLHYMQTVKKEIVQDLSRQVLRKKRMPCMNILLKKCRESVEWVETGRFGADMKVSLLNDGPFTIVLDSEKL